YVHDSGLGGINYIGLCNAAQSVSSGLNTSNAIAYGSDGSKAGTETAAAGTAWTDYTDVIGVLYTGTQVKFYRNGTLVYTCSTLPSGTLYPAMSPGNNWFGIWTNFAGPFANLPAGASAWGEPLRGNHGV